MDSFWVPSPKRGWTSAPKTQNNEFVDSELEKQGFNESDKHWSGLRSQENENKQACTKENRPRHNPRRSVLIYFRTSPCSIFLQCLSLLTELLGRFPWMADHLFESQLWLAEEAFILSPPSWAIMTKTNFFLY